jgi:thiol reductant ABC exporter CydC subunit
VLGLVGSERRRLIVTVLLASATALAGIGLLATSAWLISRAAQRPSVVALGVAVIGVRFFAISRSILRYCERLVGHDTALRVLADIRVRVFERLEALAPEGLPAFRSGDLLSRLVGDVDALQDLMLRVIPPYGTVLLAGAVTTAVIWYFLPPAGMVLGATLLAAAFAIPEWTRRLSANREARQAAARGELTTHVVDLLEGAQELVAFGATGPQLAKISATDAELTRINASTSFTSGLGAGMVTLLTGLAVWAALLAGVPAVRSGSLDETLLAVVALVPLAAFEMAMGLPSAAQSLERVRRSGARVFEVIDSPLPIEEPHSSVESPVEPAGYGLDIRGLRCRYGRGPWVLDGVDLDLPPGRRVGIVGPSGAGKSTLAAVLLRFLPYQEGSVALGGVEISEMRGEDVRAVVGLAAQDTHVFDTTLRENLVLARRDAADSDLAEALDRARLREWVEELPEGLDTPVGGHGTGMSGGQQQRLGIARIELAGFPVVVLDEPGEHLDTATADALVADLLDATRSHTTLMITHRLAGLEAMDEIVVLEAGRVVERGTHAELLVADGSYARQWKLECVATNTKKGTEP